jgi:mRNA interferase HigB
VRVIARSTLKRFVESFKGSKDHKSLKAALDAWFHEVQRAEWRNPSDLTKSYASASLVGGDRVVFNIKGNAYRMVVAVDYRRASLFIKWIGPHAEYDKIDVKSIEYEHQTHSKRIRLS